MRSYLSKQFVTLLKAIDEELDRPEPLIVIGGAALVLGYRVALATRDIDTMNNTKNVQKAYRQAVARTGLAIPLGHATVADAPYHYEDRLRRLSSPRLHNLRLFVPEKHDLALMKAIRGDQHDFDGILALHRKVRLSKAILEKRFSTEMTHVIGDQRRVRFNFDALLEQLFQAQPQA